MVVLSMSENMDIKRLLARHIFNILAVACIDVHQFQVFGYFMISAFVHRKDGWSSNWLE
jgi:hypothetical protein